MHKLFRSPAQIYKGIINNYYSMLNHLPSQLCEGSPVRGQTFGGQSLDGVVEEEETAVLHGVIRGLEATQVLLLVSNILHSQ